MKLPHALDRHAARSADLVDAVPQGPRSWVAIQSATQDCGMSPDVLRHTLECGAGRALDGGIEANVDSDHTLRFGRALADPRIRRGSLAQVRAILTSSNLCARIEDGTVIKSRRTHSRGRGAREALVQLRMPQQGQHPREEERGEAHNLTSPNLHAKLEGSVVDESRGDSPRARRA